MTLVIAGTMDMCNEYLRYIFESTFQTNYSRGGGMAFFQSFQPTRVWCGLGFSITLSFILSYNVAVVSPGCVLFIVFSRSFFVRHPAGVMEQSKFGPCRAM